MKTLIVGLGNPNLYKTVHNVGGDIVIYHLLSLQNLKKIKNNLYQKDLTTYFYNPSLMNISGEAIHKLCKENRYEKIFILFDDIRVKLGQYKIEINDKNYGHNGIKSIQNYIGNNFYRVRIGVGPKPSGMDLTDFVLMQLSTDDYNNILKNVENIFTTLATI